MNKARIVGIIIFIIGLYLINSSDNDEGGFLIGMLTGIILALGFALTAFGKLKFWKKI